MRQCIPYNRDTEKLLDISDPYICDETKKQ